MQTRNGSGGEDDFEPELIKPEDFLERNRFPADAQRMGVDRYTDSGGAFLAVASALDGRKLSHRLFAVALLVLVVGSAALNLWGQLTY